MSGSENSTSATTRLRGTVGASLYLSVRAAGVNPAAAQQLLEGLGPRLGDAPAADDRFELVLAAGRIRSAAIVASDGAVRIALPRWGSAGPVDPPAIMSPLHLASRAFNWSAPISRVIAPLVGRLTSTFGMRFHPILGYTRMHSGIDLAAAYGTPVRATADGVIAYAGWRGGYGNFVRLDQGGGSGSGYGHLSRVAVAPGESVRAGEVIGYVGATGLATGPHLHYETYRNGRAVDPLAR